jgi:type I restriction enzyme R subunit
LPRFSFAANEELKVEDHSGLIEEESADLPTRISQSNRDKLDQYIAEYNAKFGQNYNSGDEFYAYYRDIANRVRKKEIDILLVVNMFLTGLTQNHSTPCMSTRTLNIMVSFRPFHAPTVF